MSVLISDLVFYGVANMPEADALTAGGAVNTSSSGDFMMRKIVRQSVPSGVTASFDIGQVLIYAA